MSVRVETWREGRADGACAAVNGTLAAVFRSDVPEPARREIACSAAFQALISQHDWLVADISTGELYDFIEAEYDRTGGAL